jgi:hypothetical protein
VRQRKLIGCLGKRLVVTDERPGEHGHRAGEHALDRLAGQRLGAGRPAHRHRPWPADIAVQDRWAHTSRSVGLDPSVLGRGEPVELLGEVLDHVVTFRFAVHEHVQADALLQPDNPLHLRLDAPLVGRFVDGSRAHLRPGGAQFSGLGERPDRRRGQGR